MSVIVSFVDCIDQSSDILERGAGENPMPEVEDMPRPAARARQDLTRLSLHNFRRCQHHGRVEIALNRNITQAIESLIDRNAPVDSDDLSARLFHQL